MRGDRDRCRGRWPRPGHGARSWRSCGEAARYTADRASGWRNRTCLPNSISPAAAAAGAAAVAGTPSRSAARHTTNGSPTGSAAAISSSRRVTGGRGIERRRKPSSSGPASPSRTAIRSRPPALQVSARAPAQQRQRVTAGLGHDAIAHLLIERPGDDRRPAWPVHHRLAARKRGVPAARPGPVRHRAAAPRRPPRPLRSARWRATNASAWAEARSSHCASSTTQTSGFSLATSDSKLRTARLTAKRSGIPPCRRPNAALNAARCGSGRPLDPVQERRAQLMQPGELELHLRLDPRRACDAAPRRSPGQVSQQRGLADPGLAAQDQDPALTGSHARQQPIQHLALAAPAAQPAFERCASERLRTRAIGAVHACSPL